MSDFTDVILVIMPDESTGMMLPEEKLKELREELFNWRWEELNPYTFHQDIYKPHVKTVIDNIYEIPSKYGVEFYIYHSDGIAILT